jgi:hypothetical protein
MKNLALFAGGTLLCLNLLISTALALEVPERLVYDATWGGMKAGSAVQEVTAQGDELRIVQTVKSSGPVSAFLSIDDKKESVVSRKSAADPPGGPSYYREKINEGKTRRLREARFDFAQLKVHAKDLLQDSGKTDPITPRTYDSLSSIYFVRSRQLVPEQPIFFDIYDFKRLWNAEVRVVKRENVRTPLGTFKTIVVTSQLKLNGESARAGNSTVWFTDDSRRIPVKIKTKLKVGEMTLTLVGGSYWP